MVTENVDREWSGEADRVDGADLDAFAAGGAAVRDDAGVVGGRAEGVFRARKDACPAPLAALDLDGAGDHSHL